MDHKYSKLVYRFPVLIRLLFLFRRLTVLRFWYVWPQLKRMLRHQDDTFTFLEAGCGAGQYLLNTAHEHPQARCIGIDYIAENIRFCKQYGENQGLANLELVHSDLTDLKTNYQVDIIACIGVLQYIKNDGLALRQLQALCSSSGEMLLYSPINGRIETRFFKWVYTSFRHYEFRMNRKRVYTENELVHKVQHAGFHIDSKSYTYGFFGRLSYEVLQGSQILLLRAPWYFKVLGATIFFLALPLTWLAMLLDMIIPKSNGNGLMLVCKKKSD